MPDSFEELDAELVEAIKGLTSVHNEYVERYASTSPLGDSSVPTFTLAELQEITDRIKLAEERYAAASERMREYRNRSAN